jgi:hypothetical protein
MDVIRSCARITLFLLFMLAASGLWAGPPFQTDDPEPVDFRHYEVYCLWHHGRDPGGNRSGSSGI